jgi:hypothetical protein
MSKQKALEKLSKAKYNVMYLGWKECSGLYGVDVTEPVMKDMIYGSRPENFKIEELPRLVISLSRKELKITQTVTKKPGKTEAVKFHVVQTKDLMFAARGTSPDDCVIACIYLGFNPSTKSYTHVHSYLCENSADADTLLRHIYQYINTPYHRDRLIRIEREMIKKGHIQARPRPVDSSPYDEMGFPKLGDSNPSIPSTPPVNGNSSMTPDYSIYGTSNDFADPTKHRTASEQQDDNQSPYQQYLLNTAAGAPLRLPRASPRSSTAEVLESGAQPEHARLGYTRSTDSANGMASSNYPRSEFAAMSIGEHQNRLLQPAGDQYSMQRSASPSFNAVYQAGPSYGGDVYSQRQGASSNDPYQRGAVLETCAPDYDDGEPRPVVETALAAELKKKLGRGGPILLPPKDYDTINRTHGSLLGIEARKCLNEKIVGRGESGSDARAAQFEWKGRRPGLNDFGN